MHSLSYENYFLFNVRQNILKERLEATRKWPIYLFVHSVKLMAQYRTADYFIGSLRGSLPDFMKSLA